MDEDDRGEGEITRLEAAMHRKGRILSSEGEERGRGWAERGGIYTKRGPGGSEMDGQKDIWLRERMISWWDEHPVRSGGPSRLQRAFAS